MKRTIYSNYDLYDNFDDTKQFIMDEYPELCEVEVEDAKTHEIHMEPSDSKVWDFIYNDDSWYWDETWSELKNFFKDDHVIFFGTVGTWRGNFAGGKIGYFEDLVQDAIQDCDYVEFTDEDGHLYLRCSHHDGTNDFEIKVLSQKGSDFADNWENGYLYYDDKRYDFTEQELHKKIATNNFLSHLPHYWKRVYA